MRRTAGGEKKHFFLHYFLGLTLQRYFIVEAAQGGGWRAVPACAALPIPAQAFSPPGGSSRLAGRISVVILIPWLTTAL